MRLYEHLHPSIRKSGLKKYKNQGIYDNSDASSWSLLRNGLWISSVCGKNTNVTMENIPGYVRSEYSCHVLISPARGSAFLSRISAIPRTITQNWFLLNSSTCNVFDAANEIVHDFYSIGQLPGGRTG